MEKEVSKVRTRNNSHFFLEILFRDPQEAGIFRDFLNHNLEMSQKHPKHAHDPLRDLKRGMVTIYKIGSNKAILNRSTKLNLLSKGQFSDLLYFPRKRWVTLSSHFLSVFETPTVS